MRDGRTAGGKCPEPSTRTVGSQDKRARADSHAAAFSCCVAVVAAAGALLLLLLLLVRCCCCCCCWCVAVVDATLSVPLCQLCVHLVGYFTYSPFMVTVVMVSCRCRVAFLIQICSQVTIFSNWETNYKAPISKHDKIA